MVDARSEFLQALGGEAGCKRLSAEFYARVRNDSMLRPLFPGKSLRCATEEFAAFLIQFLGGDEDQAQLRWWLSLRESHARFRIGAAERSAWLRQMQATLDAAPIDEDTRKALRQFFFQSSAYIVGKEVAGSESEGLGARWAQQRTLDEAVAAIAGGHVDDACALTRRFASRPSVFVGLLARMMRSGSDALVHFVIDAIESDPSLLMRRFAGKTLLHFAAGAGCPGVVKSLLRLGADPNALDSDGHTPLYRVANECASDAGPVIVGLLVHAGGDVNAHGGVTRTTPLHMAARRGFMGIAQALLDCGAAAGAKDTKGDTPHQRALNCRKTDVARLLAELR